MGNRNQQHKPRQRQEKKRQHNADDSSDHGMAQPETRPIPLPDVQSVHRPGVCAPSLHLRQGWAPSSASCGHRAYVSSLTRWKTNPPTATMNRSMMPVPVGVC